MLSKIKIYFWIFLAALFGVMGILIQSFRYKAEKYKAEAKTERNNRVAVDAVRQVERNMKKRQRAARKETENAKRTIISSRPGPDSDFGSPRLRNKD